MASLPAWGELIREGNPMCISSVVLHLLCCLAADRIDIKGVLPNPGGSAEMLAAEGRYWVAPGHKLVDIELITEFPDSGQLASQSVNRGNAEWNGKLFLLAGEYDCHVELATKNAAGMILLTRTPTVRATVK
jgi:hypothetical protein